MNLEIKIFISAENKIKNIYPETLDRFIYIYIFFPRKRFIRYD